MFHEFNNEIEDRLLAFLGHLSGQLPIGEPKEYIATVGGGMPKLVAKTRAMIVELPGDLPKVQRDAMVEWLGHWYYMANLAGLVKMVGDDAVKAHAVATYEEHMAAADLLMRGLTGDQ